MKLFHYTTIDALALILNSKSLKFNRLDQLDDLTEAQDFSDFNPLPYIFSSSFTDDYIENIALWKMYANMETGVRLEFESTLMFTPKETKINQMDNFKGLPESIITPLESKDIVNDDYFVTFWRKSTDKNIGQGIFLEKIQYKENVQETYQEIVKNNNHNRKSLDLQLYGFYKSKYWEFQKEVRFLIYTIPFSHDAEEFESLFIDKRPLKTTSIYVPLSDYALNNLKIVLAPKITDAARLIVKALTSNLTDVSIQDSILNKKIR